MGHILHDWDLQQKLTLLAKAYEALPDGGALIVFDAIIDDERRTNAFGLLMSLNMLIETPGGFDYTGADCQRWMHEVGFRDHPRRAPRRARLDGRRHQIGTTRAAAISPPADRQVDRGRGGRHDRRCLPPRVVRQLIEPEELTEHLTHKASNRQAVRRPRPARLHVIWKRPWKRQSAAARHRRPRQRSLGRQFGRRQRRSATHLHVPQQVRPTSHARGRRFETRRAHLRSASVWTICAMTRRGSRHRCALGVDVLGRRSPSASTRPSSASSKRRSGSWRMPAR